MSKEKKHALSKSEELIPELRFSEFDKSGPWELSTIGKIGNFYYGKSAPKWSLSEDAATPCVRYGELYTKFGTIIKKTFSRTNTEPNKLRFSKGHEILIPRVGEDPYEFCKCSYLPFPNIAIGEMISIYKTEEDPIFYAYYFSTLKNQFARVVEGQNVKNLYYINLEPIAVGRPLESKEQQKIASCLSSLDELIAAHSDKLETLKDHKKGLMQNLFPQKGQKVPNYRFPGFGDDGEWELKPFSKFIKLYRGSSPRPIKKYLTQSEIGVNWIKIGDTSSVTDFVIKSVSEKITPKGAEKSRPVKKGELILANSMSYGKTYQLALDGCIYDGWFVLREYENVFDKQFLLQLLNSYYMQEQYKKFAAGGIVQNISSEIVYSTLIPKTSIKEQRKVASCLSSLDNLMYRKFNKC